MGTWLDLTVLIKTEQANLDAYVAQLNANPNFAYQGLVEGIHVYAYGDGYETHVSYDAEAGAIEIYVHFVV